MTGSQEHIASAKEQPENLGHGCVLLGLRHLFGLQCVDFNVSPDINIAEGEPRTNIGHSAPDGHFLDALNSGSSS
jgi:hypothetical protein